MSIDRNTGGKDREQSSLLVRDSGTDFAGTYVLDFVGFTLALQPDGAVEISGGGGIAGIDVQESGTSIVNPATALNFDASFFSVTPGAPGTADVTLLPPPINRATTYLLQGATEFDLASVALLALNGNDWAIRWGNTGGGSFDAFRFFAASGAIVLSTKGVGTGSGDNFRSTRDGTTGVSGRIVDETGVARGGSGDIIHAPGAITPGDVSAKPGTTVVRSAVDGVGLVTVTQAYPLLRFENVGTGAGAGENMSCYVGTDVPTHTANTASVFLQDDNATGRAYLNTSPAGGGTVWTELVKRGDLGGITLTWGGEVSTLGEGPIFNGPYTALDEPLGFVPTQQVTCAGIVRCLAYNTRNADATTRMRLFVNGAPVATLAMTGLSGVVSGLAIVVADGDLLELEYFAGAAPGNSVWNLFIAPT